MLGALLNDGAQPAIALRSNSLTTRHGAEHLTEGPLGLLPTCVILSG